MTKSEAIVILWAVCSLLLYAGSTCAETAKCIRVVDGDTIVVDYHGKLEKIRLIGVDTPETVHPNKPVEYFGKEASNFTRSLVTGKQVALKFDWQQRDKYNRLLAYVYLDDGTLLNKKIIEEGYGHAYTRFPFKYMDDFRAAECEARKTGKGLWRTSANATRKEIYHVKNNKTATDDNACNKIVYVTGTGKKYHRGGCRYLRKSRIPVKLCDAIAAGYTPCRVCRPSTP